MLIFQDELAKKKKFKNTFRFHGLAYKSLEKCSK